MTLFNVIVFETNAITLQVEAEDDIEAARLVESDINKYPVISEEVVDWNVDFDIIKYPPRLMSLNEFAC